MQIAPLQVQLLEHLFFLPWFIAASLVSRWIGYDLRRWRAIVPAHVALAIVLGLGGRPSLIAADALLHQHAYFATLRLYDGNNPWQWGRLYASQSLDEAFQYLVLQALFVGYTFYLRFQDEHRMRETLALQYERARLQTLRMRINPHFLYNTLSAIAGLVSRDPNAAKSMVTGLGDLFRRSLADRDTEFITLHEELELAERYLNIQQLRFSDRLVYSITAAPELRAVAVPPLLLQPLLENAVEHGIGLAEGRVDIQVQCQRLDERVEVCIVNRTQGALALPRRIGAGIGIAGTRERLIAAFGASAAFEAGPTGNGEYRVRMSFAARKIISQPATEHA